MCTGHFCGLWLLEKIIRKYQKKSSIDHFKSDLNKSVDDSFYIGTLDLYAK